MSVKDELVDQLEIYSNSVEALLKEMASGGKGDEGQFYFFSALNLSSLHSLFLHIGKVGVHGAAQEVVLRQQGVHDAALQCMSVHT